ncbi:MAG: mechanosensitive ion channel family protein [Candidatus Omnitrophica bacterium]|nr:mechanosensitive ion channel family protein [Candidatus Omnitrophota bacterium]
MIQQLANLMFWKNSILDYLIFVLTFFVGFLVVKIFEHIILRHLKKWAEKTATTFDDFIIRVIKKIGVPLAYFGVFYLGINILTLHSFLKKTIDVIAIGSLTLAVVRFGIASISYGLEVYLSKREENTSLKRSLDGILVVIKVVIWGLAIVFFLDNLGFKISAVIAGLGIGGVAVALAAQAVLGDLFSYFAILFDRPFEIGDFIITGDHLGTVEHVGIKTTRIRSLSGEQLIFSNTDLTNSRVRNYKRMEKRRVLFKLGVTYQTTSKQVKAIPKIIENIIKNIKDTVFDRAHFFSYGDFALIFEIVYYVLGSDYNKYMDIQQEINFAIKEKFETEGIEFAYPTQTLYVNKAAI